MSSLSEKVSYAAEVVAKVKTFLFGTKADPTWLRRTFGKAAEWIVIACAVLVLLSLLQSCERHAAKAKVSLLSLGGVTVEQAVEAPAKPAKPAKVK